MHLFVLSCRDLTKWRRICEARRPEDQYLGVVKTQLKLKKDVQVTDVMAKIVVNYST